MKERLLEVFSIDLRSLASFRIGLGLVLLADLVRRALDLETHYADLGVLPRATLVSQLEQRLPRAAAWLELNPHFWFGGAVGQGALFALAAGLAVALILGWRTRTVTVLSWILLASLHGRNPALLNLGDVVLRVLLFWAMWLPLGARWSFDARRRSGAAEARRGRVVGGATAALMLQIGFIYVFNALLKRSPAWTEDFTALELAFHNEMWTAPLGTFLLGFPVLLRVLTACVIWLERLGPFLALSPFWNGPLRTLAALSFAGFHLGILLTTRLDIFPWVCLVAWIVFLPPGFWNRVGAVVGSVSDREAAPRPERLGIASTVVTLALVAVVLVWNLGTLPARHEPPARAVAALVYGLRLDQRWAMFAPGPGDSNVTNRALGTTAGGISVDLLAGAPGRPGAEPEENSPYQRLRWRMYLSYAFGRGASTEVPARLADHLARRWEAAHSGAERLVAIRLDSVTEPISLGPSDREPAGDVPGPDPAIREIYAADWKERAGPGPRPDTLPR